MSECIIRKNKEEIEYMIYMYHTDPVLSFLRKWKALIIERSIPNYLYNTSNGKLQPIWNPEVEFCINYIDQQYTLHQQAFYKELFS